MKFIHSRRKHNSNHKDSSKWKFDILPCPGGLYAVIAPSPPKPVYLLVPFFPLSFYSGFHLEAHSGFYVYAGEVRRLSFDEKRYSFRIWEVLRGEARQLEVSPSFLFSLKNSPVHSCVGGECLLLGGIDLLTSSCTQLPFFFISARLD